jgi:hypothetical protein
VAVLGLYYIHYLALLNGCRPHSKRVRLPIGLFPVRAGDDSIIGEFDEGPDMRPKRTGIIRARK